MTPSDNSGAVSAKASRFLSRAETLTLLGMVLSVASLFLTWERVPLVMPAIPLPTMYLDTRHAQTVLMRNGFSSSVRWPITVCAVLSGAMLLGTPRPESFVPLAAAQFAGGLACLVIALSRFAALPGVLLGLAGGILLVVGALDRFAVFFRTPPAV